MNNNDVIRSIQQILQSSPTDIADIFKLAQQPIDQASIANLLKEPGDADYQECNDLLLTRFLDGLITLRRGKSDKKTDTISNENSALNNNLILKKLRIAFDLKEDDVLEMMSLADFEVSKSELSSVFRKPGNKHYRICSDDFLMGFLVGLSHRIWR